MNSNTRRNRTNSIKLNAVVNSAVAAADIANKEASAVNVRVIRNLAVPFGHL